MFEILEHTADIGVRATASSLPELFTEAAWGLQESALETEAIEPREEYPIEAEGGDLEALLVNWLNELVYFLDGKRVCLAQIEVTQMSETRIAARAWGEPRDPDRHPARLVVKAATYHQLRVVHEGDRYTAEFFLDI